MCLGSGKHIPATDVDHKIPFKSKDDPLRLNWNNLDSKCHRCHSRKTIMDMKAGKTRKH